MLSGRVPRRRRYVVIAQPLKRDVRSHELTNVADVTLDHAKKRALIAPMGSRSSAARRPSLPKRRPVPGFFGAPTAAAVTALRTVRAGLHGTLSRAVIGELS